MECYYGRNYPYFDALYLVAKKGEIKPLLLTGDKTNPNSLSLMGSGRGSYFIKYVKGGIVGSTF